jgi:hypothetical protein
MLIARVASPDEFRESVTDMPTVVSPEFAGVPEIVPVWEFIANPAGRVPVTMAQLYGATPPLTESGAE